MEKPVKFGRGVENKYRDMEYLSKCGGYRIESIQYTLPTTCTNYNLFKLSGGEWWKLGRYSHDTLGDAKLAACYDKNPNYEG